MSEVSVSDVSASVRIRLHVGIVGDVRIGVHILRVGDIRIVGDIRFVRDVGPVVNIVVCVVAGVRVSRTRVLAHIGRITGVLVARVLVARVRAANLLFGVLAADKLRVRAPCKEPDHTDDRERSSDEDER